ncbi:MAG: hypothetical protein WC742_15260 [Gallionellaceae bacterium]|jgi:hypothetical protein
MKISILIGFALAVVSSSAYAWTKISAEKTGVSIGTPGASGEWTDKIKCNNKAEIIVNHMEPQSGFTFNGFHVKKSANINAYGMTYYSMDQAAKAGCNEK